MNQREYNDLSFNSQWLVTSNQRLLVGGDLWHFIDNRIPNHMPVEIDVWPELPVIVTGFGNIPTFQTHTTYCFRPKEVATMGRTWMGYEVTVLYQKDRHED